MCDLQSISATLSPHADHFAEILVLLSGKITPIGTDTSNDPVGSNIWLLKQCSWIILILENLDWENLYRVVNRFHYNQYLYRGGYIWQKTFTILPYYL
jgi:hypothetical protein